MRCRVIGGVCIDAAVDDYLSKAYRVEELIKL